MVVFKILNKVTGQNYVGSCRGDIYERWELYARAAEAGLDFPMYREIRELGEEQFSIVELDFTEDREELKEIELLHTIELKARSLRAYKFGVKDTVVKRCTKTELDQAWMKELSQQVLEERNTELGVKTRLPASAEETSEEIADNSGRVKSETTRADQKSAAAAISRLRAMSKSTTGRSPASPDTAGEAGQSPAALSAAATALLKKSLGGSESVNSAGIGKQARQGESKPEDTPLRTPASADTLSKLAALKAKAQAEKAKAAKAQRVAEAQKAAEAQEAAEAQRVAEVQKAAEALEAAEAQRVAEAQRAAEARRAAEETENRKAVGNNAMSASRSPATPASVVRAPSAVISQVSPATQVADAETEQELEKAILAEGIGLLVKTLGSADRLTRFRRQISDQSQAVARALTESEQAISQLQKQQQLAAERARQAVAAAEAAEAANSALSEAHQRARRCSETVLEALQESAGTATEVEQLQDDLVSLLDRLRGSTGGTGDKRAATSVAAHSPGSDTQPEVIPSASRSVSTATGTVAEAECQTLTETTDSVAVDTSISHPEIKEATAEPVESVPVTEKPEADLITEADSNSGNSQPSSGVVIDPVAEASPVQSSVVETSADVPEGIEMVNRLKQLGQLLQQESTQVPESDRAELTAQPGAASESVVVVSEDSDEGSDQNSGEPESTVSAGARAWVAPLEEGQNSARVVASAAAAKVVRRRSRQVSLNDSGGRQVLNPQNTVDGGSVSAALSVTGRPVLSRKKLSIRSR